MCKDNAKTSLGPATFLAKRPATFEPIQNGQIYRTIDF